ncbi:uncharacterized protein PV09_09083 [Verruconis gallopava]|uniref:Cell morphogenesis protein N-terminal domain-containing protein n=1 Tax=Verruconis gallopava TaxID=253628 RepID=A0A0D1ZYQ5_9PEZI|nr:uncharacterized protein PV09_09083 [Verruconis gallopava]KIV99219.1 hypothetical protein PV09_09083 [Verruconis gallopava]
MTSDSSIGVGVTTPTSANAVVMQSNGYGAMAPPPVSQKGHSPCPSFGQEPAMQSGTANYRRPERMHSSGRTSRSHNHTRSQSRSAHPQAPAQVMVSEYALHHLFNAFIGTAEQKINLCLSDARAIEPRVETICGPGVDPAFDQLVSALGHIARQKPKPLIDSLMLWRKQKSEAANAARDERAQALKMLSTTNAAGAEANVALHRKCQELERRSTISIYLLCRVLLEIFSVCTLADVGPDMSDRLQDIIYKQLSRALPDELESSPFRQSNWVIFGQLLGSMSEIDFANVTARFLQDLESMQIATAKEPEGRAVLVIRGMRWLRVKSQPDVAWNQSCEFMINLAKMSVSASGQPVKYAFNNLFRELLLPLAATATSELNTPRWRGFIEIIKPRLQHALTKPKNWSNAFPALVAVVCASPHEIFVQSWMSLIMPLQSKLKERSTRPSALRGICRLVWTYLYRIADTQSVALRNLQEITRLVFIPGRKSYISTEPAVAEPLIQLVRIIGYKYQKFCFENILFPALMSSELYASGKEPRMIDLEPEKVVIGIRSFLAIMTDLEKGQPPPFPKSFDSDPSLEPFQVSSMPLSPRSVDPTSTTSELSKEERLSRPVMVSGFDSVTKESYNKFCKILAEITLLCDKHFGGQAELDGRFATPTPKTPMAEAFSFTRREEHATPAEVRQTYYDLLHVAVQALPRCLSPHISFKSLINLLCTGTAHVQGNIAASSAQSLKAIARQSFAQQVTVGFARFIFNFDDRYSTMSDGGMLGPDHIESTLRLYIELLEIWIEEIKQKTKRVAPAEGGDETGATHRGAQLDLAGVSAHVDEVESHGLFFLCSPACRVRTFAISVLRLVTEFDTALGKTNERIIHIIEKTPEMVVAVNDEKLSVAERSRLQRGMRASNLQTTLIELCGSDVPHDAALWLNIIFPNIIRLAFETCPFAVTLTRESVCSRISQMMMTISRLGEVPQGNPYSMLDLMDRQGSSRFAITAPDLVVEQWKLYLIFACSTLTNKGPYHTASQSQSSTHVRKGSKSSQPGVDKVLTANELFAKVIPFLCVTNQKIREAVVVGLGSINHSLYKTLLECLQPAVVNGNEEAKIRMHQRSMSNPRRNRRSDLMRTEVAHVYKMTSRFLHSAEAYKDEWILNNLVNYTKDIRLFLSDAEISNEWEYNKLRTHFCGLMEELYQGIIKTADPLRWMPFQSRKAAFSLMEDWCGYSPNEEVIRQRERRSMLDRDNGYGNTRFLDASMEIEKRNLKVAALNALATLCAGPVNFTAPGGVQMSFDVGRMVSWIDTIFSTPSDKTHAAGRRALKNLIIYNQEFPYFLNRAIEMCYCAKSPKALESYFKVVTDVLMERSDFAPAFWKILCAGLYTLGNENNQLRVKSVRLLRLLEERQNKNSKLQDLDISISDKTIAVYKRAQFETSQRLAQQHPELAFHVFSEFSRFFKDLQPDHQRNIVAAMLPWIQAIELQIDPNGGPTAASYMLLVNLFEITVKCGNALHNEIQALWQALSNGPHAGNVQLVLDFIITLCLDRKEQNFVDYAKQIVVYLAGTPAGSKVVEFLQLQITPKAMVLEKDKVYSQAPPPDAAGFPYLADLGVVLPAGTKQQGFSPGQLCLILLVDLMVAPMKLSKEAVPLLLHVIFILWDHYIPLVQDQAREMLVHLMHELVISQIDDGPETAPTKRSIENFIDLVRGEDAKVVWAYEDYNGKKEDDSDIRLPPAMNFVATEVINIFSMTYPSIREDCSKMALKWASICPVHHLACRSFQVFRTILGSLEQVMLADMLARLSNTIADDSAEVQTFSLEILTTMKKIIDALAPADLIQYPQLFWTTCACLDTIHEREFLEALAMLERFIDKVDLSDEVVIERLSETFPVDKWSGHFDGVQVLLYKGVRSSVCLEKSLKVLEKLVALPSTAVVGDDSRFLYTLLANLPRFLRLFETMVKDPATLTSASTLAHVASGLGYDNLADPLDKFTRLLYANDDEFLQDLIPALKTVYFPAQEYQILVFLFSLLTNKLPWFKIKTMHLLCVIIPHINMRNPEITNQGSDLLSPLLRLLQTEFCPQALAVMDELMMTMTATPLDNKHLRMSMAGANTSRAQRKEFENVKSLYGIPEDSGWSIPMPAAHAKMTRENVHAVFYTCATPEVSGAKDDETPTIELVSEDYPFPEWRTATMMSDDTRQVTITTTGDLVDKLDQLDDFFNDEDDDDTSEIHDTFRESTYEQQTLPILHRSLKRNASVSSFQTGFGDPYGSAINRIGTSGSAGGSGSGDVRISPSREAMIMTPTAFGGFAAPPSQLGTRPILHSRSVTSPTAVPPHSAGLGSSGTQSAGMSTSRSTLITDDGTLVDEPWEDEEFSPSLGHPESFPIETTLRPSVGGRFRSMTRRLTGGSGDQKVREQIRRDLQKSPQVPRVPDIYVKDPKSSEL